MPVTATRSTSCPSAGQHTPAPRSYVAWHLWAEQMGRTHTQHRCPGCGLFQIWKPRPDAPDLPPIEYRLIHKDCLCCDGEALGCDCRWCKHNLRKAARARGERPTESARAYTAVYPSPPRPQE